MNPTLPNEFKFRAWTRNQADRFLSVIPKSQLKETKVDSWSDSSSIVIVTISVQADLSELHELLNQVEDVDVILKTLCPAADFKF